MPTPRLAGSLSSGSTSTVPVQAVLAESEKEDQFLVTFGPDDPENPKNWGRAYRWLLYRARELMSRLRTLASSSPVGITQPIEEKFRISDEVSILVVSLFVLGYSFGPILWGPLSEQGLKFRPVFIIGFVVYTGLQVGDALAPNTAALLIFRFLSGCFAASPLTNSGGLIADIWDAKTRGKALAVFSFAPFAGPTAGPIIGGYIAVAGASWRWLYWTTALFAGLCLTIIVFLIPETYTPILLAKRAQKIRAETGDSRYHAPMERAPGPPMLSQVRDILSKPFILLVNEPMLVAVTAYLAFIYGCIYLEFEAYPIVFGIDHHLNAGVVGLTFLPVLIGAFVSLILYLTIFEGIYARKADSMKPLPVPPEERLRGASWLGPIYVISYFWFGWTSYDRISFWASMLSGLFLGAGFMMIFLSLVNYTVDAYLSVSASALAVQTIVRSFAGAGFPLFATQLFNKLTPRWASTLLGLIALLLMPIPLVLTRYGPALRARSKYMPKRPN
ncbi:hypothetical protein M422DRAFT_163189 [Sphaerobolus stellatus SS14]|uniref:Major facilitator superfamily (MFS) profile domain-containing protein n=1 Tax=Sphaerobolus stellatus (strain SS14) TaxID=990650 RepID=A0A0C9VJ31_SPHS4|nr:hypothetical protein M422DRAFT_163189 [Sphaerobolus stellatus SS14]